MSLSLFIGNRKNQDKNDGTRPSQKQSRDRTETGSTRSMRAQDSSTGIGFGMTMAGGPGGASAVPDAQFESAPDCFVCDKKFHAFRRKHRCRVSSSSSSFLSLTGLR